MFFFMNSLRTFLDQYINSGVIEMNEKPNFSFLLKIDQVTPVSLRSLLLLQIECEIYIKKRNNMHLIEMKIGVDFGFRKLFVFGRV